MTPEALEQLENLLMKADELLIRECPRDPKFHILHVRLRGILQDVSLETRKGSSDALRQSIPPLPAP